jgi:hypothetical protein
MSISVLGNVFARSSAVSVPLVNDTISNVTQCAVASTASHGGEHDVYIQALLLLVMITVCINLHHWLHHKNFRYLSETAIYLIMGKF